MTMRCDEIIAEVWRNRDAYTALHHDSLEEMVADLRERQKRAGLQTRGQKERCPARTEIG